MADENELRRRRGTPEKDDGAVRAQYIKTGLDAITPQKYRESVHNNVAPALVSMWIASEKALPVLKAVKTGAEDLWQKAQPYHPNDLLPALCGLAMVFFGGQFSYLIAAITAVQVTGTYASIRKAVVDVYEEMEHVFVESKKDDAKDADGDGVPDVQQIDSKAKVQRKIILAAKSEFFSFSPVAPTRREHRYPVIA